MAHRKLGKVGNLGEIIPSFLFSEFSILPGFKNLGKKFLKFPRFPRFPSFQPGHLFQTKNYFEHFKVICKQIKSFFCAFWRKILSAFGIGIPGLKLIMFVYQKYFIEGSKFKQREFVEKLCVVFIIVRTDLLNKNTWKITSMS